MTTCLEPGYGTANGPCSILTAIDVNGAILTTCDALAYIPADCPDDPNEGAIDLGPAKIKIASVDGTVVNTCLQRGATGAAYATAFRIDTDPCTHEGTWVEEETVRVGNSNTANDPGLGTVSADLVLRGTGDYPSYAGNATNATYGALEIRRYGARAGWAEYDNVGGPDDSVGGHRFKVSDPLTPFTATLMEIDANGGTLYFPAWTYVSDIRLKSDIAKVDELAALENVKRIEPITYSMNGQRFTGFSAQNIQAVLPDAVTEKDGILTMRDGDVVATLLAAVKALTAKVEALEAKCSQCGGD